MNTTTRMNVAVVQMTSVNEQRANEMAIFAALRDIEAKSVDLVVFPENVWYLRLVDGEMLPDFSLATEFHQQVQAWVDQHACAVIFGAVPVTAIPGGHSGGVNGKITSSVKPFSATAIFEPGRSWHVPYTKVHLFDVDVTGHKPVRESDHLAPGSGARVWEYRGWKFGCAICYDVRFAELFSLYAAKEVDALFLPSAFLVPTGRQHWEILVRARAIESQVYMLAPAQSGDHVDHTGKTTAVRKTYGRSMIVDPWGRILAAAQAERSGTEILISEMNREEIAKVRVQIPMKDHRRLLENENREVTAKGSAQ
ncbi:carbon-nitrogen hydrolase family protein [soil metagenome]